MSGFVLKTGCDNILVGYEVKLVLSFADFGSVWDVLGIT
jgi:hypothetical protein